MARVDLHVHSKFSDRPSEWFLKRLGAAESYTDPEALYAAAKAAGMDFVTITDHNSIEGALLLRANHPDDVFLSVEVTTYFPADGCKIHLLVWGIDEAQFEWIKELRKDVFDLAAYVRRENLAHSVAHATFAVNDKLTPDHLEKLVVLFDSFEVINGARTRRQNVLWQEALSALTPTTLARLAEVHGIEPSNERPWVKGFTGGSDDHAGLLVGRTWTETEGSTPAGFVEQLRCHRCSAGGRHNDYRTLAFSVYKIACDFSSARQSPSARSLLSAVSDNLFGRPTPGAAAQIRERIAVLRLRTTPFGRAVADLVDDLRAKREAPVDERLDVAYGSITKVADELVRMLLESVRRHAAQGDVAALVRDVSAAMSSAFVAAPFLSTLNVLSRGRRLGLDIAARLGAKPAGAKRVLWFTDTLSDLNGVSITLRSMTAAAVRRGDQFRVAACLAADEPIDGVLELPWISEFPLPFYESQPIRVPSVLASLRLVQDFEPDEIVVSTPGPVGLLGLACARLMGLKCTAVYHTDFAAQLSLISKEEAPSDLVAAGERWFYGAVDEVLVPTQEYIRLLTERGMAPRCLKRFRRGFDSALFSPQPIDHDFRRRFKLPVGPISLYVGRVSHDKDIMLLIEAHRLLQERILSAGLLIVGSGPHLEELRTSAEDVPGVVFAGAVPNSELPRIYAACDVFVFPSTTDTFGMAVLEAQACMLPAIVSDRGGPQEIIVPDRSGTVLASRSAEVWSAEVERLFLLKAASPQAFGAMREAAWRNALNWSWDSFLDELMESPLVSITAEFSSSTGLSEVQCRPAATAEMTYAAEGSWR